MFAKATLVFATLVLSALTEAAMVMKGPDSLSMCEPATIKLSGGKPPYKIAVYKSCDDSDDESVDNALATYEVNQATATVQWMVNIPEYQSVQLGVTDANGKEFYSDDYQVKSTKTGSCTTKPAQFNVVDSKAKANPDSDPSPPSPPPPATMIPSDTTPPSVPTMGPAPIVGGVGANSASSTQVSFALITIVSAVAAFAGMC